MTKNLAFQSIRSLEMIHLKLSLGFAIRFNKKSSYSAGLRIQFTYLGLRNKTLVFDAAQGD